MSKKRKGPPTSSTEDILQQLDVWQAAGIPRPAKRLFIDRFRLPKDVSTGRYRLSRCLLQTLEELLPWCLLRRDYPSAVTICAMLWRVLDLYRLRNPRKMLSHDFRESGKYQTDKRSIVRLMESTTELMLASGLAARRPLLPLLKHMVLYQLNVRRSERAATEVAVQLLEAGNVDEARGMFAVKVSKAWFRPEKAGRTALQGLVAHVEWMRPYSRHMQAEAEAEAEAESEAPSPASPLFPLHAWEHVQKAWSRANADPAFREDWRECERCLREGLRHLPGNTTKLSYYLAQSYCAAGRVVHAVTAAATASKAAPGDPDAVALAILTTQLQDSFRQRLGRLEAAAGLPRGSVAPMLGLQMGDSRRRGRGKAAKEEEEEEPVLKEAAEVEEERDGGAATAAAAARRARDGRGSEEQMDASDWEPEQQQQQQEEEGEVAVRRPVSRAAALLAAATSGRGVPEQAADRAPGSAGSDQSAGGADQRRRGAAGWTASEGAGAAVAAAAAAPATAAAAGDTTADAGGSSGLHSSIQMQLEALQSDPLCTAALAGLACSRGHCSSCALALVRGCLLHLDCCTTGVLCSPYEGEAWALLDSALAGLAAAAAAAPREPSSGDGDAEASAGRRRRKHRRGSAAPPEAAAVALWRRDVEPELRQRAQWWRGAAFSEPPVLLVVEDDEDGVGVAAAAAAAAAPLPPPPRAPDAALLRHLQHRARVAVMMLGPCNIYTQHVLYELHLLRQRLADARDAAALRREREARRQRQRQLRGREQAAGRRPGRTSGAAAMETSDSEAEDSDGACEDDDMDEAEAGGVHADESEQESEAEALLAADIAAVGRCMEAVLEAVESARALVKRLAPSPKAAAAAALPPLPDALLAGVPRALRRWSAAP